MPEMSLSQTIMAPISAAREMSSETTTQHSAGLNPDGIEDEPANGGLPAGMYPPGTAAQRFGWNMHPTHAFAEDDQSVVTGKKRKAVEECPSQGADDGSTSKKRELSHLTNEERQEFEELYARLPQKLQEHIGNCIVEDFFPDGLTEEVDFDIACLPVDDQHRLLEHVRKHAPPPTPRTLWTAPAPVRYAAFPNSSDDEASKEFGGGEEDAEGEPDEEYLEQGYVNEAEDDADYEDEITMAQAPKRKATATRGARKSSKITTSSSTRASKNVKKAPPMDPADQATHDKVANVLLQIQRVGGTTGRDAYAEIQAGYYPASATMRERNNARMRLGFKPRGAGAKTGLDTSGLSGEGLKEYRDARAAMEGLVAQDIFLVTPAMTAAKNQAKEEYAVWLKYHPEVKKKKS